VHDKRNLLPYHHDLKRQTDRSRIHQMSESAAPFDRLRIAPADPRTVERWDGQDWRIHCHLGDGEAAVAYIARSATASEMDFEDLTTWRILETVSALQARVAKANSDIAVLQNLLDALREGIPELESAYPSRGTHHGSATFAASSGDDFGHVLAFRRPGTSPKPQDDDETTHGGDETMTLPPGCR
jgi:hypothetical protein